MNLTPGAIKEVKRLLENQKDPELNLRLGVQGGGCSGMSYFMNFDKSVTEQDKVFDFEGLKVVVDVQSLLFLMEATLDFTGDLMGGGFKFLNPKAKRSCGCGSSFSV